MNDFATTHFRFEVQALRPLAFEEYAGSARPTAGRLISATRRSWSGCWR